MRREQLAEQRRHMERQPYRVDPKNQRSDAQCSVCHKPLAEHDDNADHEFNYVPRYSGRMSGSFSEQDIVDLVAVFDFTRNRFRPPHVRRLEERFVRMLTKQRETGQRRLAGSYSQRDLVELTTMLGGYTSRTTNMDRLLERLQNMLAKARALPTKPQEDIL